MSFTQITLTGTYTLPSGVPATGTVSFTPTIEMANGSILVPAQPFQAHLDGSGSFSVVLPANDDPAGTTVVATTI